jgi:hypothetical protein
LLVYRAELVLYAVELLLLLPVGVILPQHFYALRLRFLLRRDLGVLPRRDLLLGLL